MEKRYRLLVFIIILIGMSNEIKLRAQTLSTSLGQKQGDVVLSVDSPNAEELDLEFTCNGVTHYTKNTKQGNYSLISLNDCGYTTAVGKPQLPVIRQNIEIPHGAAYRLEIVDYKVQEYSLKDLGILEKIFPVQPSIPKIPGEIEKAIFHYDGEVYNKDQYILKDIATIATGGSRREHKFAVLEVYPVDYNPAGGKIKIYTDIKLKIFFSNIDIALTRVIAAKYYSKSFDDLNKKIFLEYKNNPYKIADKNFKTNSAAALSESKEVYLIITAPTFQFTLAPFVQERQKKYEVTLVTTAQTGATKEAIKAYIQNAYSTWAHPPVYVLLVGDIDAIPNWWGTSGASPATDLYYVTLDGPDYFPDAYVGRFSVSTVQQLSNLINKILNPTPVDYKKSLWIASADHPEFTEGDNNFCIDNYLVPKGWTADKVYSGQGGTVQNVVNSINANKALVVYGGHGSINRWIDPSFDQSKISSLTNTIYPVVFSFACETGNFAQSEVFGETWIRAQNGATAFIGSSVTSSWNEDSYLERGIFKGFYTDTMTISEMLTYGKHDVYSHYGNADNVRRYYEMYNVFGDPSQEIIPLGTMPPPSITVNLTYPLNDATGISTNPRLRWDSVSSAQAYTLQVSPDSLFMTTVVNDSALVQTSKRLNLLSSNQKYFWRVQAKNQIGRSDWSPVWRFATGAELSVTVEVMRRWNLVSLPIIVSNPSVSNIFPATSSSAFGYQSGAGYRQQDTLRIGKGYWLKFTEAQAIDLIGILVLSETTSVRYGWNLIGSISGIVPTASITSDPPGIVTSNFFGYNNGYIKSDTILPGQGYWVKVNQPGSLILTSNPVPYASNKIMIVPTSELPPLPPGDARSVTKETPNEYALLQSYPNPFNSTTTISYALPVDSKVSMKIYDLLGQVIATLVDERQSKGYKTVEWSAPQGGITSGIYLCRLEAINTTDPTRSFVQVQKLLLLK